MTSWRSISILSLALLAAFLLYPRAAVVPPQPGKNPTELTLWVASWQTDSVRSAVELFERQHRDDPNGGYVVHVGISTARDDTGDATRFLLGVAGGAPPDLIFYDRFAVVEAAARGAFKDLNPYIERDARLPDAIAAENYVSPAWLEPRYKDHQYAIPIDSDSRALILSDDALERANFKDAQGKVIGPKTWADLCLKKVHAYATVSGNTVQITANYTSAGAREFTPVADPVPGDLVTLRSASVNENIFRARIAQILPGGLLQLAPSTNDGEKTATIPPEFTGPNIETKIFDKNSYALRLTRFDTNGDLATIGFSPLYGNSWLYLFGFQNNATFLSPDGNTSQLDAPEVQQALQFIVDCYDAMGGYQRVKAFEGSFQKFAQDPFLLGKIAMRIDGNWFLDTIATYRPDLRFSVVPAPMPDASKTPITWGGGFSYAIPATAQQPEAAWQLLKFLVSPEGIRTQTEVDAGIARGKGKPFIPPFSSNIRMQSENRARYLLNNPQVTPRLLTAYDTFVSLLPQSRFRPVTPVGQKLWTQHADATEKACYHTYDVHTALHIGNRNVQHAIDRVLHPPAGVPVNWNYLIALYLAIVLIGAILIIRSERRHRAAKLGKRDWLSAYLGISPWLLGFLLFSLGPILFSLIISFCNWDILNQARFTGLDNYRQLLGSYTDPVTGERIANDPEFWTSLQNTAFMIISVPLGIILGLAIAILLNTKIRGIAFFRTLYYLPAIVPSVATFLLWIWIFDDQRGIINRTLRTLGLADPPKWLQSQTWSKPAIIIMLLWGVGGGMLIWLAGLKNIPQQLYEAAEIDGAGRLRRFFHITLPMLSPYIFFNFILGLIGVFQIFESAYMMTNGGPADSTLFYAYKLFNEAFRYLNMGTAAAMAWIMFLIVLLLTLLNLYAGKKWVHYD